MGMKQVIRYLVIIAVLVSAVRTQAQDQDWSGQVLQERDPAKKEQLVCVNSMRGEVTAEVLAELLKRERHGPAVAAAVGRYFENGQLDAAAPDLLIFAANRPDIGAQAVVYATLCRSADEMIPGLAALDNDPARQVAARMVATYALLRTDQDRLVVAEGGKRNRNPNEVALHTDFSEVIKSLSSHEDELTREYTLLAAAWDGVALDPAVIEKLAKSREPGLAMAIQFYLAATGGQVDEPAVLEALTRRTRRGARDARVTPLGYDVRATPRHYAVMAAGAAGLTEAIDPLVQLLTDEDVTLAVEAAWAIGRIQDASVPGKLVAAFNQDLAWPVRVAVYDGVGRQPDKASIELLRQQFDAESGRLRRDALYALLSIIAGKCDQPEISSFDSWWRENGEAFVVDPVASAKWRADNPLQVAMVRPLAGFYNGKVISDRPVFVVDASKSMQGAQIESLKQTLSDTVLELPKHVKFNIVDFGGHVRILARGGLIPAENRAAAMQQFSYEMELTYGTRSYDAMEDAAYLPEMDSIHFLSDGAPAGSEINHWGRIAYVQRMLFHYVPVSVNIVYFPEGAAVAGQGNTRQVVLMRSVTNMHAGEFVISGAE